jgi:hypothetical protein
MTVLPRRFFQAFIYLFFLSLSLSMDFEYEDSDSYYALCPKIVYRSEIPFPVCLCRIAKSRVFFVLDLLSTIAYIVC